MKGRVFDIQRFSIHDGPGIRTTVFLKGCPLRCLWCHNPEGLSLAPIISFVPEKCIGCGFCFRTCRQHAHSLQDGRHLFHRELCRSCGECTKECYTQALELIGKEMTAAEVMAQVLRDLPFYETSGGGMTLSGGEPLHQPDFALELLKAAKTAGLHCCLETSGFAAAEVLRNVCQWVDLFLFDIKETDAQRHREFTGVSNEMIFSNLRALHAAGAGIVLRLPIIPGLNARDDHFAGIAALVHELPKVKGVELMFYHPLGESKVQRFGLSDGKRARVETPNVELERYWISELERRGVWVINQDAPN